MPLKGRLGLDSARVPHVDRHGLIWLERGRLAVERGNLVFTTAGTDTLEAGAYDIPFQQVSNVLLGPGTVISHDALRILARQKTGILAIGSGGVRLYATSMPFGPDRAKLARRQAVCWNDKEKRIKIARKMYSIRFGGDLPEYNRNIDTLRGIEGKRLKRLYQQLASQFDINWNGRKYDRNNPDLNDDINKAINHAATATYAAAQIAVAVTGTIPQLGFIHESSGRSFALDIADLHRASFTLPIAFQATKKKKEGSGLGIEAQTRILTGEKLKEKKIIHNMIGQIKDIFNVDDNSDNS